jgi:hypothetical protein
MNDKIDFLENLLWLTKEEATKHDSIFYYEWLASMEDKKVGIDGYSKLWDKVRKNIDWFQAEIMLRHIWYY